MKTILRVLPLTVILVLVSACAPISPAPTSGPTVYPPPQSRPAPEQEKPSVPTAAEKIKPSQSSGPTASTAVSGLLTQGWAMYQRQKYSAALSVAERAQRIDARNPEVYLLMARSQLGLYQTAAAEQLVRRGLSLSRGGTGINRQLQRLLDNLIAVRK